MGDIDRGSLEHANDLLRSAYQIAARDGVDTNWEAFRNRVGEALVAQAEALRLNPVLENAVCTAKTFRKPRGFE